jgi:protein-S-isoprenylcysteine O-methyltransferase Ste14
VASLEDVAALAGSKNSCHQFESQATSWVDIPFEEAKKRRQFGAAYDNYIARVQRWI